MAHITHIVHLADVHIRAGDVIQSRQDEYLQTFWRLEKELDALECVKAGTALGVVCGDVFHHKYRLEGPAVKMWTRFIHTLTDRMEVVIISGNHDFRQERPNDPDLLEVMIGTLPPLRHKCHYIRDTQVVELFDNIDIGVVAIRETLNSLDTSGLVTELPEFPLPRRGVPSIALFHGTITQSSLPNGQRMSAGKGYPLEWFKGYDMVLLGDNHLQQWHPASKDLPSWGYPGSLIQQDFGEPVFGHGFLLWDIANKTASMHHVHNDYARIRAKIIDGQVMFKLSPTSYYTSHIPDDNLPRTPIVQVIGHAGDDHIVATRLEQLNIVPHQISSVIQFQQHDTPNEDVCDIQEIHNQQVWVDYLRRTDPALADNLTVLQWIESPEKIIGNLAIDGLPSELQTKVRERSERIRQAIGDYRTVCDRVAKVNNVNLVYLEWSWAFAYGERNWFNFQTLEHDIALLNGKNASGKSSFIDILCISLFGEPGKNRNINTAKRMNSLIIHHQKPSRVPMSCSVVFDVDGERYVIERVYTTHKTKTDEFGIQMSKCDLRRFENAELICSGATLVDGWVRERCGTIEDMMESAIVSQMDIHNFFMLKPAEQKERIDQSLNLESVQAYGQVLQQAILAYNLWIETLSTYIQSQRASTNELFLDNGDDVDVATLEADLTRLMSEIAEKERICHELAKLCPEDTGTSNVTDNELMIDSDVQIPCDIVERRGALRQDLQEFDDLIPSLEEAFVVRDRTCTDLDINCVATKCRPLHVLRTLSSEGADAAELEKWQRTIAWANDVEANDYGVCSTEWQQAYDDYLNAQVVMENVATITKPVRPEEGFPDWEKRLDNWNEAIQEATENKWPNVAKCKKALEKCEATLAKWDSFEQEATFARCSYDENRKTWKQERSAFREREKSCLHKSGGLLSLEEAKLWTQKCDAEAALENDVEWRRWESLIAERDDKWGTALDCRLKMTEAMAKKVLREHHEKWIPRLRKDIQEMRELPFNPACEACARNPIHCERARLEKELEGAEQEWKEKGLHDLNAIEQNITYWMRSHEVMTEIEKSQEAMAARKTERAKLSRVLKKIRDAFGDRCAEINAVHADMKMIIVEWMSLETTRSELERRKEAYEKKEQELATKIQDITSKQRALGYDTRDDIVDAIEGWKYAYDTQIMIENKREWMEAEIQAWETAKEQWEPWNRVHKEMEEATLRMAPIRERAERAFATLKARVQVAKELRVAEFVAAERSIRCHRAKEGMAQILAYQQVAFIRYKQAAAELTKLREDLRHVETTLTTVRKASEWKNSQDQKISAFERIWQAWRSKRDVLQATFQRLIGGKDDKDTFKEWIYESFAIPLLEKHVNSFLAESTSSALWIEIEYSAKALGFVVYDRGNRTTFGLSSGFQQFIIGLAFRLALTRLGGRGHRFRTLIIDEGFVACDADNVQNAREILQNMMEKGGFRHILLATHLDTIKDMIGRKIHIERDGAFSQLRVGSRLEWTPMTVDKPKRGRPKKDAKINSALG